jgi:hypothetical protein
MCFVWPSEQAESFTLQITNRLVFITEVESFYWAVRTETLYNTDTSRPERVNNQVIKVTSLELLFKEQKTIKCWNSAFLLFLIAKDKRKNIFTLYSK